jgi:hypothetical protein
MVGGDYASEVIRKDIALPLVVMEGEHVQGGGKGYYTNDPNPNPI